MLTTHGLMTADDLADHHALYDTGVHPDCPGHDEGNGFLVYCPAVAQCPDEDLEPM